MTLVRTSNPFAKTFDGLVNELFNELPNTLGKTLREDVWAHPPVNITEHADAYKIEVSAPGYNKADFNVKLDGNLLTINAEGKTEHKVENEKVVRKEFTAKNFKRSFTVDDKVDATNITAKYENGILFVTLAKKAEVKNLAQEIIIQ
jgi:HSP20 family protein